MFSLLQGLWKGLSVSTEKRVLLLGLDGAGKTTLMECVKGIYSGLEPLPPSKIHSTVGLNIARIHRGSDVVLVWDMGGKQSLRGLWKNYLSDADAIVWVLDATDVSRLEEVRETMHSVLSESSSDEDTSCPLLLLANKHDTDKTMETHRVVSSLSLAVQNRPFLVIECSALTGEGIQDGFDWLIERLLN